MKFLGIIPARYASTRFPGKPLAMLGGKPMIQRVYERASMALEAVVATDDRRIYDAVKAFGGNVVMTSDAHRSGTDRCREAYANFGVEADVVLNIQGDEPFIDPGQITALMKCFDDPAVDIATLVRPFSADGSYEKLADPNTPKVVVADNGDALYFSRSVIPYLRGHDKEEWPHLHHYLTHVGVYAFRTEVLKQIVELPQSPLEIAESLEQLRWLQGGYRIRTAMTEAPTVGIDTPADLEAAEKMLIADRTVAPATVDCSPVSIAPGTIETLDNGIRFHYVAGGDQPVVRLTLLSEGGMSESSSPAARTVMADTVNEATASYDSATLADIIDFNGARLEVSAHDHFTGIETVALASRLDEIFPLIRSILTEPKFDPHAVEVSRRKQMANCATRRAKVEVRTSEELRKRMFGQENPTSRIILPEDYETVDSDAYRAEYAPVLGGISYAFLAGALTQDDIKRVRDFLATLPGKEPSEIKSVAATPCRPEKVHIEMPDTLQWAVSMGLPAVGRYHPDYNALRLTVVALGGYFGSRLMKNIREEKGLTYGITSQLNGLRDGAYVEISARCDRANMDTLIEETKKEMRRLAQEPPTADELRRLRLYVWSQLASAADSPLGTISHYISNLTIGAPEGYFGAQLTEISNLTSEKIAEMARKYLNPDLLTIVTAGD